MSKHKSKFYATVGVLPLLVLLGAAMFLAGGCTETNSSTEAVNTGAITPSVATEMELLAQIDRKFVNPQAHYELAKLYHRQGQWTKAEYHYELALEFQPGLVPAQAGYAKLFMDEGQRAKGAQMADEYIRQASDNATTSTKLGWAFESEGLSDYAQRCFRQALSLAPDSAEVNKQVGLYYLGQGNKEQARQYLARSIEVNPNQPEVAGELGRLGVVIETAKPEPEAGPETQSR